MRSASLLILLLAFGCSRAQVRYFGKALGSLSSLQHGVRGELFAVDSRTLYLRDFYFDGEGPSAYFFVGTSGTPQAGPGSARLRDERGGTGPLRKYSGESITLTLPEGSTLKDYRWFSVYCEEYQVNFGDVSIPRGVEPPRPARAGALSGAHGVASDPIVVVDAQTLLVPHFSYDGEAPDAKFWVGRGDHPSPQGIRIPDENGKEVPLRRYNKKTIVLTLPGELTVFDIGHFGVWCEAFTVDFGHVTFPRSLLANVPPSLKMLGVSPQSRNSALVGEQGASPVRRPRPPPANLRATTYRPAARLRPGAELLTSLQHDQHDRTNLHRRANTNTPPEQLVSIQHSRELTYHQNGDNNFEEQQYRQQQEENDYHQQQQKISQQHQDETQPGSEPLILEQHYQKQHKDVHYQQQKQASPIQYQKEQQRESEPLTLEQHYQQQQTESESYQLQQKDSPQYHQTQQQEPKPSTPDQHYQQQQKEIYSYQQEGKDSQRHEQTQKESPSVTIEQQYQQLLLQQQLLEKELKQRQQLLQEAQEQLYYSQQPQNFQQQVNYNQPQTSQSSVESLQQQIYEQNSSEEPVQYRLLPY